MMEKTYPGDITKVHGIRAGHAAGAVTVMIPDMAQPTPEIEQLYTRRCNSLLEVRDLLLDGKL